MNDTFHRLEVGWCQRPAAGRDVNHLLPHVAYGLAKPVGVAAADHDGRRLARGWIRFLESGIRRGVRGGINVPLKQIVKPFKEGFVKRGLRISRHGGERLGQIGFVLQLKNCNTMKTHIVRKNRFVGGGGGIPRLGITR
jgi:hypothetical protein